MEEELELSDGASPALPIVIALKPLPMALGFGFGLTQCFFVSFLVIMDVRFFVFFSFFLLQLMPKGGEGRYANSEV